jgi:hypothetical protein
MQCETNGRGQVLLFAADKLSDRADQYQKQGSSEPAAQHTAKKDLHIRRAFVTCEQALQALASKCPTDHSKNAIPDSSLAKAAEPAAGEGPSDGTANQLKD